MKHHIEIIRITVRLFILLKFSRQIFTYFCDNNNNNNNDLIIRQISRFMMI